MKISAIKDIASYAIALCVMKGTSLLMLPFVTRYLTPTEYGQLELLTITSAFIALLVSCSLHEALYRFAAYGDTPEQNHKAKTRANQIFTLSLIASIGLFVVIGGGALGWQDQIQQITQNYSLKMVDIAILSGSLCLGSSLAIGLSWLRITNKVRHFAKTSMVSALAQALLVMTLLELGYGITGVLLAGLTTHAIQWLWVMNISQLNVTLPSKSLLVKMAKYTLPLSASAVVAFGLNGAERWLILHSADLQTLGQYAIASKFALATCILVQPFGLWWMPKRFTLLESNPKQTERITLLGVIYIGTLIVTVASASQLLLPMLLTAEYHPTVTLILGALFMILGKELTELVNLGLLYRKQTQNLFKTNLCTTVLGLSLCLLFANFGVWSVMISIGIAQLFKMWWVFRASQQAYPVFTHPTILLLVTTIVVSSLVGLYLFQSVIAIGAIGICSLVSFACMAWLLCTAQTSRASSLISLTLPFRRVHD